MDSNSFLIFKDVVFNNFAFALMTLCILLPFTEPGQIALTLILYFPSSIAKLLVNPIIAHLLAAYGVRCGNPNSPAVEDKFIIADEMQNASIEQMVMLMTRIGKGSKLIIIGDPTQCDRKMKSNGLADLVNRIKNSSNELNHIKLITLENKDIQREAVVREVINKIYNDMPNRG